MLGESVNNESVSRENKLARGRQIPLRGAVRGCFRLRALMLALALTVPHFQCQGA